MKLKILTNLVIVSLLISCSQSKIPSIIPTNNKGGYTFVIKKTQNNTTILSGYVRDIKSKKPLTQAFLKLGCSTVVADSNGFYVIESDPVANIYLTSVSIGYKTIETEYFSLNRGDSTNIDFFLTPDDRPLLNCEGKSSN